MRQVRIRTTFSAVSTACIRVTENVYGIGYGFIWSLDKKIWSFVFIDFEVRLQCNGSIILEINNTDDKRQRITTVCREIETRLMRASPFSSFKGENKASRRRYSIVVVARMRRKKGLVMTGQLCCCAKEDRWQKTFPSSKVFGF